MELQPKILDVCRDNQIRMIEAEISKNPKMVANVQSLKIAGTYRNHNLTIWANLLPNMSHLQSIELHYWSCDAFLDIIQNNCTNLKEIILSRQKCSLGRLGRAMENLPSLVTAFQHSLRVLIVDVGSACLDQSLAPRLQKALADVKNLECLKLEARESPYLHWNNCRYRVRSFLFCSSFFFSSVSLLFLFYFSSSSISLFCFSSVPLLFLFLVQFYFFSIPLSVSLLFLFQVQFYFSYLSVSLLFLFQVQFYFS